MFTLRKALPQDIDSIMLIENDSFIPQIREEKCTFEKRIEILNDTFLVFIDSSTNKTIGYLSAEFLDSIPSQKEELSLNHLPSKKNTKILYISSFALLSEFRGGGNGRNLFSSSIDYFTKNFQLEQIVLLVNALWQNAKHIYEKNGFTQINVFRDFFKTESNSFSDGILMKKSL